jgi:hypothetical protein
MDNNLAYKKPRGEHDPEALGGPLESGAIVDFNLPTFAQLQQRQCIELLEIARVKYGVRGGKVDRLFVPLKIEPSMSESQIFRVLLVAPECERADQVLYALAVGHLDGVMANTILAGLALLGKFKKIAVD